MKNVLMNIKGVQYQDGQGGNIDYCTNGTVYKDGESFIISYDDTETPFTGKCTEIFIEGDVIRLKKAGEYDTEFVFKSEMTCTTSINTPIGSVFINLFPTVLSVDVSEDSGRILLEYIVDPAGMNIVNKMDVSYGSFK